MIPIETLNLWADSWTSFIWSRTIDSTIVLVIVGFLWLILRKRVSAQFGYLLFSLVLLKLVIPIQLPIPAVIGNLFWHDSVQHDEFPWGFEEGGDRGEKNASPPVSTVKDISPGAQNTT